VVADLLASRRHLAHNSPACKLQIHALVVRLSGHEEELLLKANEGLYPGHPLEAQGRRERGRKCYYVNDNSSSNRID
jgi:hypothetical protein